MTINGMWQGNWLTLSDAASAHCNPAAHSYTDARTWTLAFQPNESSFIANLAAIRNFIPVTMRFRMREQRLAVITGRQFQFDAALSVPPFTAAQQAPVLFRWQHLT